MPRKPRKAEPPAHPQGPKRVPGRPERVLKLDATPEQVAQAIFRAAKPPRPPTQDQDRSNSK